MNDEIAVEYRIKLAPSGLWEWTVLYGGAKLYWGARETEADAYDQTWLALQEIRNQMDAAMKRIEQEYG
jgi:hypothetical protein